MPPSRISRIWKKRDHSLRVHSGVWKDRRQKQTARREDAPQLAQPSKLDLRLKVREDEVREHEGKKAVALM